MNARRRLVHHKLARILRWLALSIPIFFLLLSALTWLLFCDLPGPSPLFDCDDAVLVMWHRLSVLGIKATPVAGNLKMTGESYDQITHVWLLVEIAGLAIPFDWGQPWFDRQHYEGYAVTHERLLEFVQQDLAGPAGRVATGGP